MVTTTNSIDVTNNVNNLLNFISFEYDDDIGEYCAFFNGIEGYYGQGKTKNEAFLELLSSYLDTKDLYVKADYCKNLQRNMNGY